MSEVIATQAGHWYHRDGSPCYSIVGKNGKERPTTLRDARTMDLLPSVTTILQVAAKPGLEQWKINQVLMAALTLPRIEGEDDEAFAKRCVADSKKQGEEAAKRGTELHTAIELYAQGKAYDERFNEHVREVEKQMYGVGLPLREGQAEHTFACEDGFAGKVDWHATTVVDFKSKERIEKGKQLAWDEHRIQLGAYQRGLGLTGSAYSIFVGIEDAGVVVHKWEPSELADGRSMFFCLLRFWQLKNVYQP